MSSRCRFRRASGHTEEALPNQRCCLSQLVVALLPTWCVAATLIKYGSVARHELVTAHHRLKCRTEVDEEHLEAIDDMGKRVQCATIWGPKRRHLPNVLPTETGSELRFLLEADPYASTSSGTWARHSFLTQTPATIALMSASIVGHRPRLRAAVLLSTVVKRHESQERVNFAGV